MKIYVASSFHNKDEVRAAQMMLRDHGHEISHDWTPDVAPGERGSDQWNRYLWNSGRKDYDGIMSADAMVILNDIRGRDMLTEYGMAMGRGIPVFFLRATAFLSTFVSVFLYCPNVVICDTMADVLHGIGRFQAGLHLYTKDSPDCVRCGCFGPVDDNEMVPQPCERAA